MRHIWYNTTAVKSITGKYGSSTEPPLICATKPPINGPIPKPKPFKDAYQRAVWASLGKGLVCNMPIMPEVLMRPEAMPMMTRAQESMKAFCAKADRPTPIKTNSKPARKTLAKPKLSLKRPKNKIDIKVPPM